jgi:hypothetical protein
MAEEITREISWAKKRQRLIETILTLVEVALIAVVIIATLYKAPSCTDGKQNQNEAGIDCGDPCPYLCSANEAAPVVSFVRAVSPQTGRTDVIAYIENKNTDASVQAAKYTVELYDSNEHVVATKSGTINLPPATTAPLYIPDFYLGPSISSPAVFLTFDGSSLLWTKNGSRPVVPTPNNIQIFNGATPKITATLTNPIAYPIYNETVVATVFDAQNNAIAASQTVIPILPAQGSAPIVFTWNQAFSAKPVRVEILPST